MRLRTLALRGATYYRRTNVAVALGIACAVAVLAGALTVGDSVRASLRELSLARLGRTDVVVTSEHFFRADLAADLADDGRETAPIVLAEAFVTDERSGQRAARVQVAGVDERFWRLHHVAAPAVGSSSDAWISEGLGRELDFAPGDTLLLRTRRPSSIPGEFLHGQRDDVGRTLRLNGAGTLTRTEMGEFSLRPRQGAALVVFVPLARLQRDLGVGERANGVLVARAGGPDAVGGAVRARATLEDMGIRVRSLGEGRLAVESERGLLDDAVARAAVEAARAAGASATPMFTYVVNAIRKGDREVPYSLVTARGEAAPSSQPPRAGKMVSKPIFTFFVKMGSGPVFPPIYLNTHAAERLGATLGDEITLEYYIWTASGRLETRSAQFSLAGVVPIDAADPDFAPYYPGISDTDSLADWEPPFPIDLSKITPADEEYWERHRTTPKGFVGLEDGQALWRTRWGQLTSVRVEADDAGALARFTEELRRQLDPTVSGLVVLDVRRQALRASVGATDFGEYFTYFSFFITAAALLLAALFFRLGVEQRIQQVGLLRAVGYRPATLRALFLMEAAALALVGSLLGMLGAIAYAWLVMLGLRTWWVGAVGTTLLSLHPSASALAIGAIGGLVAALLAILYTLARLGRAAPRALIGGDVSAAFASRASARRGRPGAVVAITLGAAALLLSVLATRGAIPQVAGFFGAGILVLAAALTEFGRRLAAPPTTAITGAATAPVAQLGARYASWRRGRSVLSAALIAAAVFLIVSVEAFRRDAPEDDQSLRSGTGGAELIAESTLPIFHDPNSPQGRDALNLTADAGGDAGAAVTFTPFRLREGDDASCVNLYRPQRPRIIGAPESFIRQNRFTFASSMVAVDDARADGNPWQLLERREPGGAIPAIADATSLQYVLHLSVGNELSLDEPGPDGRPLRLRIVGSLADSVLQGELIVSERHFTEAFPDEQGYRFFLIDVEEAGGGSAKAAAFLEDRLEPFGFDAVSAPERLASFHQVENTYLSTFQALGALGLLLGTVGLGAIAVRNVLERRRELALLRAIGYRAQNLTSLVLAENALLLTVGIVSGIGAALVAIAPVLAERGGRPVSLTLLALVAGVFGVGVLSSLVAARASARGSVIPALRSE